MILRKPYAVFIKYFKVLHIVLFAISSFLLYTSFTLFRFFDAYSVDYRSVTGNYSPSNYLNIIGFIFVFFALVLTIVFLSVMLYKKKPKNLYLYSLVVFIFVLVVYFFCNSSLHEISTKFLDIKLAKALRDFSLIACLLQLVCTVLFFVRATGFDIKQFDFSTDLQKLDISEKDSEEIEVALSFDKDATKRRFKNRLRNAKYVYFEHKFWFNTIIGVVLVSILVFAYLNYRAYSVRANQGSSFDVGNVTMNVQDSFILENDANGNALTETKGDYAGAIVVVRFQVKSYGDKEKLNTGLINLRIGNLSYGQNIGIGEQLYDIGSVYNNQDLSEEFETYIMAFEVSKKQVSKKMKLKVNDNYSFVKGIQGAKSVYVSLKPNDLRKDEQIFEKKLGEEISFEDSIIGVSNLKINNFEIDSKFLVPYRYCYANEKCYESHEYVAPNNFGNYFKSLMRLSCDFKYDSSLNIADLYDVRTLLNLFGIIDYTIDDRFPVIVDLPDGTRKIEYREVKDVKRSYKINSDVINPDTAETDDLFIEVPYEIKNAKRISLIINIRNRTYKYALK